MSGERRHRLSACVAQDGAGVNGRKRADHMALTARGTAVYLLVGVIRRQFYCTLSAMLNSRRVPPLTYCMCSGLGGRKNDSRS